MNKLPISCPSRHFSAIFLLAALSSGAVVGTAYGHGLGEDRALPVIVGEKSFTVTAKISPALVPLSGTVSPSLTIRAHDANSNMTIGPIDFKVVVQLRNETLLDQRFKSSDGIVLANLLPDSDSKGWQISGHETAAPNDQINVSQNSPVELRSGILASGGLYHLTVTVEKTSTGVALPDDISFDLYVSVAQSYEFTAETPQGEQEFGIKTYYDDVGDFDHQNGTVSFAMPFSWDAGYVSQVSLLHIEVQFPKSIEALRTNSYLGTLNGVTLPASSILIDDYSSETDRVVHFSIPGSQLPGIAADIEGDATQALFTLTSTSNPRFPIDLTTSPKEKYLFQLSWGPEVIETGIPITFVMNIQDPVTTDLIRQSSFDFVISQGGTEIYRERLEDDFGAYSHKYTFPKAGVVTFSASNMNGEGESAKIDLVVLQGTANPQQPPQQPSRCLIATAAYGSELAPQVQYLRDFREQYILSTAAGSAFMNAFNSVYYSFSPQVADYEREQPWLQSAVRAGLYPLFGILVLAEKAHLVAGGGELGAVVAGVTASGLIGATYLAPAGVAATSKIKKRWMLLSVVLAGMALIAAISLAPALLPLSTSAFILVIAGVSALLAAKPLLDVYKRVRRA